MAVDAGYIASQQKRYTDAITANNKDLIGRLEADAKRVGYTLTKPKPTPAPAPKPTPASTATKAGSALGSIAKATVPSILDNAIAKAKLEPIVQAANNQTIAQPKPATTSAPTLDAFVSASQNTQAKPAFDMFTKPVAPVTTSAPVTTPFYNPTPVSTQTTLEKQAGILPTPTPTIEAYKAVAPTPTPTYTPSVLSQPQTQLEKEAGIVSMTPLASGKQLTQGAVSGIAQGIEEATGQPSGLQEAFNKATTAVTPQLTETEQQGANLADVARTTALETAQGAGQAVNALDSFLTNPTAETWDAFNKSGIPLSSLTPEQRKIVEGYRAKTETDPQEYEKEVKRIEDKIIDNTAKGLDTASQESYLQSLRQAFEENMRQQKEYDAYGKQLVGGILEGITSGAELGTGAQFTPETSQLMQYGQKEQLPQPIFQTTQQQEQPRTLEDTRSAFRATASEQVDKQLAQENKALDLQIEQAQKNRDFQAEQQLRAYKNAMNSIRDEAFLNQQAQAQSFANRGLLQSGLMQDALVRLGIGQQQQFRQLGQDQQAKIAQLGMDYQQTLDRINLAKDKLRSGRAQNVDELTRQLISDQQDADKYKAEILKTEADRKKAEAQQIFDYVNLLAKESGYDMTPFVPFALAGDAKGLVQAMQQTGNLQLSTAGRELESRIRENEAQAKSAASGQIADKARASQIWSDINGYISDENGKPILKNGKVQPTYGAQMEAQKIAIDRQKAAQAGAKKEETTNEPISSIEANRQLNLADKSIQPLLQAELGEKDIYQRDQKTGRMVLNPSGYAKFKIILNRLQTQLGLNQSVVDIMYDRYGVPRTVSQSDILAVPEQGVSINKFMR